MSLAVADPGDLGRDDRDLGTSTETNLIVPNTAAYAEQEQVRQAVAAAIERGLIPHPAHYGPTMVDCHPAAFSAGQTPNGYRCAADVQSETNATGTKRMLVCAELSAGRVVYSRPQAGGVCRVKP